MQDLVQSVMQPFTKLTQANTELIQRFVTSPEVASQSMASAQALMQQAQESTMKLAQSNAFATLMQGMLKNYTEFMTELGQTSMAALAQGQAAIVSQVNEASDNVVDVAESRARRTR